MRADNSTHVILAAKQRHELTRAKAIKALRELSRAGEPVGFATVAERAGVSRSWLYTQPDIKVEIDKIRATTARSPKTPLPARQRGSDTSLLHRLEIANRRIRELNDENQRLRRQLTHALGDNRHRGARGGPDAGEHVALR